MMTRALCVWVSVAAILPVVAQAERVVSRSLDGEWKFLRDDKKEIIASAANFTDGSWARVTVPHDWAISGPFNPNVPGWSGKLPWQGQAWYRKSVDVPAADLKAIREKGKAVYLEFDGVMASPEVWVNGVKAGGWDYGYMSFRLEVARLLKAGANVIAVHCSTLAHRSRWYPGAGIYRPVRLVVRPAEHVVPGSMNITTPIVTPEKAVVRVRYETPRGAKDYSFDVPNPRLWSIEDPYLYSLEAEGETFRYGIRTFRFDKSKGFFLNGKRVQLKGVDLHSDMGPLGMAFDKDVMKRQLLIMKDMGFNALRTSHNAVAPQVLDLCDEMGVFVWNECFDKWDGTAGIRNTNDLEKVISRNLRQFVRRDRNHPSVFCWSIGNEIAPVMHDNKPTGMTTERFRLFRKTIREEDVTRPVAIGCCSGLGHPQVDFSALDMTGWNYGASYRRMHNKYPNMPVLYSESASAVSEYGFYEQPPAATKTDYARDTLQVGSYDHNAAPWSDIPDVEFDRMEKDPYCCGEFVWTGIDYLGEPTPIANGNTFGIKTNECETARSSYFGAVDLCGIPKDRFYLYRSYWNDRAETIHILPHWNWKGREGRNTPVYVYTSGDEAELFLNGRSLGRQRKGVLPVRPNLAAGKTVMASSTQKDGKIIRAPELALDGNNETRWCASSGATNEWWQVDLGERTSFDSVIVQFEAANSRYGYSILLSDDGKTWREHYVKDLADGGVSAVRKSVEARFVRVLFSGLAKGHWASIRQVIVQGHATAEEAYEPYYDVCAKYRLRWLDVPYEPGELKVVAYRAGKRLGEQVMRTAADPVAVKLTEDPYNPTGARTRFVQVDLVDVAGVRDPLAMRRVSFSLTGPGQIVAVGNGNPRGLDVFTNVASHPLYYGKAVVAVRFDENAMQPLSLTASAEGLKSATLEIRCR